MFNTPPAPAHCALASLNRAVSVFTAPTPVDSVPKLIFHPRLIACLMLLSAAGAAVAELGTRLEVGRLEVAGWVMEQARVELHTQGTQFTGSVTAKRVRHMASAMTLQDVHLECQVIALERRAFRCTNGRLRDSDGVIARIPSLQLHGDGARWDTQTRLTVTNLGKLSSVLSALLPQPLELTADGTLQLRLQARGNADGSVEGSASLQTPALALNNAQSTIATDGLQATGELGFVLNADSARYTLKAELKAGYAFANPVLHDYSRFPATLSLSADWRPQRSELRLRALRWQQPGVAVVNATGTVVPAAAAPLKDVQLSIEQADFPGLYSQLLEPLLAGTPLDELSTAGTLRGQIHIVNNQPQSLRLDLTQIHIDDRERRFALYGLDGTVRWQQATVAEASELRWDGLYFGRLPFGSARWAFQTSGAQITSTAPLLVGFFDGAIALESLHAQGLATPNPQLDFQATLEPVSLALITSALGLPSFPGKVAGRLPPVHYQNQQLRLDGPLTAEAFGGTLCVTQVQVDEPLGLVPRASADIQLRNLDLAQLTSVFDFGRIEGPVNADISGLELQAWIPVAFDAHLYTPRGDKSPHRISQRAVNNISRVGGGGAAAALSSSFLRYFENFGYKRIGWSCVLRKGVCRMGGAGPTGDQKGYYLVEGKGLPRIDVVGYADEVSWDTLLSQLQTLSTSPPPSVR